ncbi:ABC transporter permease [Roseicitreum antarcticum]|uniref:Peptide/nickel transport system permease protein n=1 Tax=Roseicitreum antarcticum TaxID=564137 RepID=A0A1H2VSI8_9RHOB|nr:ABC transporter permease [Roseicitreum antarcticum]SDW70839.1 peptide/nickel transport system permease protein [Roseicitreum antarcticum]
MTDITQPKTANSPPPVATTEAPFRRVLRDFMRNKVAVAGLILFTLIVFAAVFAPLLAAQDPYDLRSLNIMDSRLSPGEAGFTGAAYPLGTDGQGRDMLSAILYGLRISLGVGVIACTAALMLGLTLGLIAAYSGGRVDTLIMRLVDLHLSFPPILVALILLAVLGRGVDKIVFTLIVVQWATFARVARATALSERKREYVEAAESLGLSRFRIISGHLLPNCLPPLMVLYTVEIASAIALEATLSFLGVGLPATQPSLGLLISNGFQFVLSGQYWISVFPGLALLLLIVSINLVGDHLRDVLNPRNIR